MRSVQFDHVEASALGHLVPRRISADGVHICPVHGLRNGIGLTTRDRGSGQHRQLPLASGASIFFQSELCRPLATGMSNLAANFCRRFGMDEIDKTLPLRPRVRAHKGRGSRA